MAVESTTLGTYAAEARGMARAVARPLMSLMKRLSILIRDDAKLNFDQSATPDGQPWLPLKFPRARGGGAGSKPLRDRGILMASMQGRGPSAVTKISGATLEQGTNVEYASLHQHGGVIVPTGGRKFLAIPRTPEAARTPARKFPRPLRAIIGKRGGVLVEQKTEAARTKGRIGRLTKQLSRAIARVKRKGGSRKNEKIEYLRAEITHLKAKRPAKRKGKSRPGTVQYILTRRVVVPARQFLGFGQRLITKIDRAVVDFFGVDQGGGNAN